MHPALNDVLALISFSIAVAAAPFFWVMAHRQNLADDVRYAGATISVAAFHLGTSCLLTNCARWLIASTVVHLIIAGVLMTRALARNEATRFLKATVRVLFMKSTPVRSTTHR
ncbi:MAG: hypothetical protein QM817_00310 [Archangium sp.]